jgi:hypothetical protein
VKRLETKTGQAQVPPDASPDVSRETQIRLGGLWTYLEMQFGHPSRRVEAGTFFVSDFGVTFPAIQIGNVVGVPAGDARFTKEPIPD